jgi:protein SERAC1
VLRLSEATSDGPYKRILLSTSAVVFFGSPHRGDRLADAVASMAGLTLGVDPGDTVLHQLSGASSIELELGRLAFVRIWNDYNFKVKTFQESLIPSWRFSELRAEAVSTAKCPVAPNPADPDLILADGTPPSQLFRGS